MSDKTGPPPSNATARDQRVERVLVDYLRRVEQGEAVDRTALLAEHPDCAADLQEFFANQQLFDRVVGPATSAASRPPPVRLRYFGDYELLGEIARGGMGVVYKARQSSLNRLVAVKMILAGQLADDGEVKRFQAEAEAAANLRHPGVVAIYEVGVNAGQHYYSMEFVAGRDLSAALRDNKPVSVKRAAEYLREIAEIVEFAHQHGVLHRDLKPSNILIDADDRVRITDFGLAKRVQSNRDLTSSGQVLGTPSYMSPEQAAAQRAMVGPASDVYSLGTILYELLTGRPPFRSENVGETLRQVQQEQPIRPRLLDSKLPRDLETICLKCLEKEPRRRYASAQQLADELGRFLRGEIILARPIGPLSRTWRWCRRKPLVATLSAVSGLAIAATLAVLIYGRGMIASALADRTTALDNLKSEQARTLDALAQKTDVLKQKTEAIEQLSVEEHKAQDALVEKIAALKRERITVYANTLTLARREWLEGNLALAVKLLDGCDPDLRHWEWFYLHRLCEPASLYSLSAAGAATGNRLPVVADGKTLLAYHAVSDAADELAATDVSTGVLKTKYGAPSPALGQLAVSADGTTLLIARSEFDGRAHTSFLDLRDTKSGDAAFHAELSNFSLTSCAVNANGTQWAVSGSAWEPDAKSTRIQEVRLWNKDAPPRVLTAGARTLAFSPDGRRLLTGYRTGFELWETSAFTKIAAYDGLTASLAEFVPYGVIPSFRRDGSQFACAAGKTLIVFDSTTGERIRAFHLTQPAVAAVSFGDGDCKVAYGTLHGNVVLLDLESGKQEVLLRLPRTLIQLELSPDGARVLTYERDGRLRIWDARANPESDAIRGQSGRSHTAAFDPSGRLVATVSDRKTVCVWDVETKQPLRELTGFSREIYDVAFSAAGTQLATAGHDGVQVWNLETGAAANQFVEARGIRLHSTHRVEFARQREWLVGAHARGATIWDLATGAEVRSFGVNDKSDWMSSARLSADGRRLATCGHNGDFQLWDAETGRELFKLEEGDMLYTLAFSPDEKQIAACGMDDDILIVDAATGEELRRLSGHAQGANTVAFSSDGKRLVSAGRDGVLKIWEAETGLELLSFEANERTCYSAEFSPDCRRLVTSEIEVLRLWDAGASLVRKSPP